MSPFSHVAGSTARFHALSAKDRNPILTPPFFKDLSSYSEQFAQNAALIDSTSFKEEETDGVRRSTKTARTGSKKKSVGV